MTLDPSAVLKVENVWGKLS